MGDRSTETSRSVRLLMVPFTVLAGLAGLQLYGFPSETDRYFAWTLTPSPSATFMGAGYAAGVVLVLMSFRRSPWVLTRVAAVSVAVFAVCMTIATFMHLDRMHLDSDVATARFAAWLWIIVYIVVPPVLVGLVVHQQQRAAPDTTERRPLPSGMAASLWAVATVGVGAGVALFIVPGEVAPRWPWAVTPLAGRALASWMIGIGAAAGHVASEDDLRRSGPAAVTLTVFAALLLLGVARDASDFRWPGAAVYVVFVVGVFGLGAWGWRAGRIATPGS